MRVEVAEHALDGVLQQRLVVHRLDIGRLDAVEYFDEGAQFFQGQRGLVAGILERLGGQNQVGRRLLRPGAAVHAQQHGQDQRGGAGEAAQVKHVDLRL